MKDKLNPFSSILILFALLFTLDHQSFGQEKLSLSTGFGIPDLLNISVRYHQDQSQFGLIVGSMPLSGESVISVSADARYHFGGHSELTAIRPWYGRLGLNYFRDETHSLIDNYGYIYTRFGREFNFSGRLGIEIDLGTMFQLYHHEIRKKPDSGWDWNLNFPVLPSLGAGLYYRF